MHVHHRRHGFFIECGAADGQHYTNSLLFEMRRGWSGLLIEPSPTQFPVLVSRHRKWVEALHAAAEHCQKFEGLFTSQGLRHQLLPVCEQLS